MKKIFFEYHVKEQIDDLLDNAIIILDTNSILNLYRYNKENREKFLEILTNISDRLILPYQVGLEIYNNRINIIKNRVYFKKEISELFEKNFNNLLNIIQSGTDTKGITILKNEESIKKEIIEIIKESKENIQEKINQFNDDISEKNILDSDEILEKITKIFENKVNNKFSEEELKKIFEDGKIRYEKKIPPGYKDIKPKNPKESEESEDNNKKYGDLVIWKEILLIGKEKNRNIIFVSNDKKEDWQEKFEGKSIGTRKELIREYYDTTGKIFYSLNTNDFIKRLSIKYEILDTEELNKENEIIQEEMELKNEIEELVKENEVIKEDAELKRAIFADMPNLSAILETLERIKDVEKTRLINIPTSVLEALELLKDTEKTRILANIPNIYTPLFDTLRVREDQKKSMLENIIQENDKKDK